MNPDSLLRLFAEKATSVNVVVIGDVMLDTYISGTASRISPEAPVPVVSVSRCRYVPGGAANVAANVKSLGALVTLGGLVGADRNAARLRTELETAGVSGAAIVEDSSRRTTAKTRITAGGQQIVRFDEEDRVPPSAAIAAQLRESCQTALETAHVCILSDYAKSVVTPELCRWLMAQAQMRKIPVVVDPKSRDLSIYRGATVITPNTKEATEAAGEPLEAAAASILRTIAPSALLITRGEHGMSLFEQEGGERHFSATVNEVADVTGAGDTVAAALAIALGCGFTLEDAAQIANIAAGIAVSHAGTWAVRTGELLR